jgi:hypothetical protein
VSGEGGPGSALFDPGSLDRLERRFWRDLWKTAVPDAAEEQGIMLRRFGPIQASIVLNLPQPGPLNVLLGAGEPGAVADGHLEAAIEWVGEFGVEHQVPLDPEAPEAPAAEERLAAAGYEEDGESTRLVRDASAPPPAGKSDLEIVAVAEHQLETFSTMVAEGLGLDPWTMTFFFDLPQRPGWRCYLALIDGIPVATAAMQTAVGVAQLCLATTLELAEPLGCQEALLRRRIADAHEAGCHTLFLETGDSLAAEPGSSLPEILDAGFEEACTRTNWRLPAV